MFFAHINYIVVIIATIIGMGVGVIWHSPFVFGKLWLKHKGWTDEHMRAKKHGKPMAPIYAAMTLGTFFTALILATLFNSLIVTGFWGILFVGFCVWIGFVVPVKLADYLFGGDSFIFFLISIGHELAVVCMMSLVIGIFG